jgi:dipeptidyl aminopeptidase/acylaminoacyl peptidase
MKAPSKLFRSLLFVALFLVVQVSFCQSGLRIPTKEDYSKWHTLKTDGISSDSGWIHYEFKYESGNDTLFVKKADGKQQFAFPGASLPSFSKDSKWFATIDREKGLALLDLKKGAVKWIAGVQNYEFSADGKRLVLQKKQGNSSQLEVHDFANGSIEKIDHVKSFELSADGKIAIVTSLGVLIDNNISKPYYIATDSISNFKKLTWSPSGKYLGFMRELLSDKIVPKNHSLSCYDYSQKKIYNHTPTLGLTGETHRIVISATGSIVVSDSGQLFFYQQDAILKKTNEADIQVWSVTTAYEYPRQQLHNNLDTFPKLMVFNCQAGKINRIATNDAPLAKLSPQRDYALTFDKMKYEPQHEFVGPADVYITDTKTGDRSLFLKNYHGGENSLIMSPTGKHIAYWEENDWSIYDVTNKKHHHISLHETEDSDYNGTWYGNGSPGFSKNEKYLIAYDPLDVYLLAVDGSSSKRITNGVFTKTQFRIAEELYLKSEKRYSVDLTIRNIDLDQGIILNAVTEDKKNEIFRYKNNRLIKLSSENAGLSNFKKLFDEERYSYIQQSATLPPRLMLLDAKKGNTKELVASNMHCKNYDTGHAMLISYKNKKGENLKGTLLYPAGYQKEKKYPMVVYIYEKLSNEINNYHNPSLYCSGGLNFANYTTNGYLVLLPDIVYEKGNPGLSASDCVETAVKSIKDMGIVENGKIGIIGHSFGGYEVSFIITQSNTFAAAVAGAAITDLPRYYLTMNFSYLKSNIWRFETQQLRIGKPLYEDYETYLRNSPMNQAANINTPLLQYTGNKDHSVNWEESLTLHLALRRMGKVNQMIVYPNEGHVILKQEYQKDLEQRIKQWFDHYLKQIPLSNDNANL